MTDGAALCERDVAVIGGGRWARVIVDVLVSLMGNRGTITVCSPSDPTRWNEFVKAKHAVRRNLFSVVSSVDQIIDNQSITDVLVVRAAHNNAITALRCLQAGKNTFIEKPFALSKTEASEIARAATGGKCTAGHVFLFASYLEQFSTLVGGLGPVTEMSVHWADRTGEERYGVKKTYDESINVLEDVFPHVWSILKVCLPIFPIEILGCSVVAGGRIVELQLEVGSCIVNVFVERDAVERKREVQLKASLGEASIDFTVEPGTAVFEGQPIDLEEGYSSPLRRELAAFLGIAELSPVQTFSSVQKAVEIPNILSEVLPKILSEQSSVIRRSLMKSITPLEANDAMYALRELIARGQVESSCFDEIPDLSDLVNQALDYLRQRAAGAVGSYTGPAPDEWLFKLSNKY